METLPVDAHCHLDLEQFENDRNEVIERMNERLEFVVNAGVNPDHNRKTLELASAHEKILPALGLHPTYTESFDRIGEVKEQLRQHDAAAVGEIGLDHHHVTGEEAREEQRKVFRELIRFAEKQELPVVVHSREAEKEAVKLLSEHDLEVFLHCFNGTPDLAEKAVAQGMKIGVTTQVLYSNRVENIVTRLELEDLLLETDSPFLYRGDRNEPVNVRESAERVAKLKDCMVEDVIRATTANSREIFR
ncbi:MAG: TatD family hydrolase [Candidatus Nanohaloarchaea archaeon]